VRSDPDQAAPDTWLSQLNETDYPQARNNLHAPASLKNAALEQSGLLLLVILLFFAALFLLRLIARRFNR
jgi:hypothetical protein